MFLKEMPFNMKMVFNKFFNKDFGKREDVIQNSWYLKEGGLHHFFCRCGNHDFIEDKPMKNLHTDMIKFKREEINFTEISDIYHPNNRCGLCSNEEYLDMYALLTYNETKYWRDIKWEYQERVNNESWILVAFLYVPVFSYKIEKIIFEKLELYELIITKDGKSFYNEKIHNFFDKKLLIDGKYHRLDRIFKAEIDKKIVELLIKTPTKSLIWLEGKEKHLSNILFFLENSGVRFKDILLWKNREQFLEKLNIYKTLELSLDYILNHRKEKRLQKVQLLSYNKMMSNGGYNPMADYIFSRSITDTKLLVKVLKINIEIKQRIFDGCDVDNIYHFLIFLKKQFSEKEIVELWLSVNSQDLEYSLVIHTTKQFNRKILRAEFKLKFKKTALNFRAIHYELTKYSRRF
jgi:hypothetical protein